MANEASIPAILVDAIKTMGVHNGVARLVCGRLDAEGKLVPVLELMVPVTQLRAIAEGLQKAKA